MKNLDFQGKFGHDIHGEEEHSKRTIAFGQLHRKCYCRPMWLSIKDE